MTIPRVMKFLTVALGTMAATSAAFGQVLHLQSALRGSVHNDADDTPLAHSEVLIPNLGLTTTTDSAGRFELLHIPAGTQIVWVRQVGFLRVSFTVNFAPGDTVERDFSLMHGGTTVLPEVDVKAPAPSANGKMGEFEERRKSGFGRFITEDDIAKASGRHLADLLETTPGISILRARIGGKAWVVGGRGRVSILRNGPATLDRTDVATGAKANLCYAGVVLDGVFVYEGRDGEPLFDVNSLDVTTVAGVEIYTSAASIPAKYNGVRGTCSLVVIWMKG